MTWTVEAKLLPLVGVSGHLYIEIFDDNGNRALQINGLATNRATQQPRYMGLPGDSLKAYVSNTLILGDTAGATRDYHPHKGQILFAGSQQDIVKVVKAAEEAAKNINQLDLSYLLLAQNSNSIFMHMIDAISSVIPVDFQAVESVCRLKPVLPGINKEIAGKGNFKSLRERFNKAGAKKPQQFNRKNPPRP